MKKKKYLLLALCFVVCVSLCILIAFLSKDSTENMQEGNQVSENSEEMNEAIIIKAKSWIEDNFKDVYYLRNITAEIVSTEDTKNEIKYTVAMSCEQKYKCSNVYEIPFVKGMQNEIKDRKLEDYQQKAVDDYIREIEEDANFDSYRNFSVDIVIVVDKENPENPWKMYYSDGVSEAIHDIEFLNATPDVAFKQGEEIAKTLIEEAVA